MHCQCLYKNLPLLLNSHTMMRYFALTLLLLMAVSLSAQQARNAKPGILVRGQVVDSITAKPVAYATVQIASAEEPQKALKMGAADESGRFELRLDKAGKYVLSVHHVGKQALTTTLEVAEGEKQVNLKTLALVDGKVLDEIVVAAVKPLVAVDLDKITYSTEDDPDSKTNNVLDMLRKVPMITVDAEDKIELKGSGSFKIHIDGKPSSMANSNPSEVLKSMPANTVKSIEVITDPGAKYDAEGVTGIINIITNKQPMGGYTANLNAGVNTMGGYNAGMYISAKYGKLGFTGNFNYSYFDRPSSGYSTYRESYVSSTNKYLHQNGTNTWRGNFLYGYGELTYEIDTLNLLSVSFNGYGGGGKSTSSAEVYMQDTGYQDVYRYSQEGSGSNSWGGMDVNANYQRTFRKKDELLTASYRYNKSPNDSESETKINELLNYRNMWEKLSNDAGSQEHTLQVDYTTPLAKVHTLEAGAKYIIRLNESSSGHAVFNDTTGEWRDITSANDEFRYQYNIAAAYVGYNLRLKSVGFKAGLRFEDTRVDAEYPLNTAQDFGARYTTWVPSTTATYKFKQTQTMRLGYNLRVQRPGIWYLNPYVNTADPKYVSFGNPDLDVEKAHNVNFSYSFFKSKVNLNTGVYYSYVGNSIQSVTSMVGDISYTTYENIGTNNRVGMNLYASWNPSLKLRFYLNGSVDYTDIRTNNGSGMGNSGFSERVSGNFQYTFPLDFVLSCGGSWSSPRISLQGGSSGYSYYNLGISKSFLDKKLTFSISGSNIFQKNRRYTSEKMSDSFYSFSESISPDRSVRFSVSFRFGEMKQQIKQVQRGISNDDAKAGEGGGSGGSGQ